VKILMPLLSRLNYRRTILFFSLLLLSPFRIAANGRDWCGPNGRGESRHVKGLVVQLLPLQFRDNSDYSRCRAIIRGHDGHVAFASSGYQVSILDITGDDVNGDGQPDAVFEDYSGGAHCCWTYWIASLGDSPKLLREIENQREVIFTKERHDARVTIQTLDGAFDYFDSLSHASTPFPSVYLRLEGHDLKRVDQDFWPDYAAEIREAKATLNEADIAAFREKGPVTFEMEKVSADLKDIWAFEKTEKSVLTIVLAYLYGGKPNQAWRALHEYWPPTDERRIRRLITNTADTGFLGDTTRRMYGMVY
jgi:hypothetical protein